MIASYFQDHGAYPFSDSMKLLKLTNVSARHLKNCEITHLKQQIQIGFFAKSMRLCAQPNTHIDRHTLRYFHHLWRDHSNDCSRASFRVYENECANDGMKKKK